jgi:hypothetical protein
MAEIISLEIRLGLVTIYYESCELVDLCSGSYVRGTRNSP